MNDLGFFCINRKIFEHPLWHDGEPASRAKAWIELIGFYARGTDNSKLKRAHFQVSERDLGRRWNWAKTAVHRFLEYLRSEHMIELVTTESKKEAPVYLISNYEKYNLRKNRNIGPLTGPVNGPLKQKEMQLFTVNTGPLDGPLTGPVDTCYKEETKKNNVENTEYSSPTHCAGAKKTAPCATGRTLKYTDDFEEFWKHYPRKVGKLAAYKAWKRPGRPSPEILISKITMAITSDQWRRDRGQFIPHPATWLNQGRWDDEVMVVEQYDIRKVLAEADKYIARRNGNNAK